MLRDLVLGAALMDQMLAKSQQRSASIFISQMTRLERSFASYRIQKLAKDSTMPISLFLTDYARTIARWAQTSLLSPVSSEVGHNP